METNNLKHWSEMSQAERQAAWEENQAQALAKEFSRILAEWLTAEEQAGVVKWNKEEAERLGGSPSVCHSHDFCDANEAMADALRHLGVTLDIQSDKQTALIDAAWNLAKANGFWFAGEAGLNDARLNRSGMIVGAYGDMPGVDKESAFCDLLADLRHYAAARGIDWEMAVEMAGKHFAAESEVSK